VGAGAGGGSRGEELRLDGGAMMTMRRWEARQHRAHQDEQEVGVHLALVHLVNHHVAYTRQRPLAALCPRQHIRGQVAWRLRLKTSTRRAAHHVAHARQRPSPLCTPKPTQGQAQHQGPFRE